MGALKPIFDKEKIEAGFEIGTAFAGEMGQFLTNRAREADALKAAMDRETDPERYRELQGQYEEKRQWLPGGTYRQLSNALLAAAGGNVGGATSEFAQRAVVSYLQQEGASKIGDLVAQKLIKEGSAEHVAWQAIIGCTGAVGSGDACGAGALGAGASVIVNSLLSDVSGLSNESKETRRNLVSALIVGAAGALDPAAAAALNNAAVADMDNNLLNPHRDHDLVALLARQDELSPEQQSALFDRLKQAHATGTQEALTQMESVFGPEALGDTRQVLGELLEGQSACVAVASCRLQVERSIAEIDQLIKAYETQKRLTPQLEGAAIVAEFATITGTLAVIARNFLAISAKKIAGENLEAVFFRQAASEIKSASGGINTAVLPQIQKYASAYGEVRGAYSAMRPGPLSDATASTFSGGRYSEVILDREVVLYRAGSADRPLGEFFSPDAPLGVIQTRIDKAILPEWPSGGTSPIDRYFEVKIPAGTKIYIGEVGSQGGFYVGGTTQIVVGKPWLVDGVKVIKETPLK
ncbi:hemagglutinin-like secreted protein [plant metagenome]|uniref:Hemagglutinin-like secreted protein n=1 Tax=plant metagenome TaxID=1297885 RepID=A0A484QPC3_9ZZZZ